MAWRPRKLVEQLSARALGRYAIAVIGEEPQLAYNRVLLSSVLADEVDDRRHRAEASALVDAIAASPLLYGQRRDLDRSRDPPRASSPAAPRIPYSKLVFATGSRPIRAADRRARICRACMTFRDIARCRRAASNRRQHATRW